jgi:DNA-directed RNA polymerase subunit RPC12/RpoP
MGTLNEPQEWIWALAAVSNCLLGGSSERWGGFPQDGESAARCAAAVETHFGVAEHDSILRLATQLSKVGSSADYARFAVRAAAGEVESPELDAAARHKLRFAIAHREQIAYRNLAAWDGSRLVALVGWSTVAGLIEAEEAWEIVRLMAMRIQILYRSWAEVAQAALLGREFDGHPRTPEIEQIVTTLLTDPKSPWVRCEWSLDLTEDAPAPRRPDGEHTTRTTADPREPTLPADEPRDGAHGRIRSTQLVVCSIKLLVVCRECNLPTPISTLAAAQRCTSCLADIDLSGDFWRKLAGEAIDRLVENAPALPQEVVDFGARFTARIEYGRTDLACDSCALPLDPARVVDAVGDPPLLSCDNCSGALLVRPADDFARAIHRGARYLIGEKARQFVPLPSLETIAFECSNCGAAVLVDGERRSPDCAYCSSQCLVPDALWFSIHPPPRRHRFYLLIEVPC